MVDPENDADDILRVYAPYIENTAITFETVVPDSSEFEQRIKTICARFPYLVCTLENTMNTIVGYAYAGEQRKRSAYQWNVELSVYVKQEWTGRGIGKALYRALLEILKLQNYQNVYSGMTLPNPASEKLHKYFGFTHLGTWHHTGFKFGRWHDVAWYEKRLGDRPFDPIPPSSIDKIPFDKISEILHKSETFC